jgi:hypothetical protein
MTSITQTTFDFIEYINEGFAFQQKYDEAAGRLGPYDDMPEDVRYAKVIEYMSHMIEEIIEARVYVPRRSWKTNEPSYLDNDRLRKEFVAELFDITLFFRAILAYSGITGEEFAAIAVEKMDYNSKRKDHNVNGTEEAVRDPAEELAGNCPSANF